MTLIESSSNSSETKSSAPFFTLSQASASLIGGTIGGLAGVVAGHPFDTIKVRLQSQNQRAPVYRGTIHCAVTITNKEGPFGLFKGMASPMVGVALVNSLLFGIYGALIDAQVEKNQSSQSPTLFQIFVAGSGSGLVNSIISAPMELVKIQLQNQGTDLQTKPSLPKSSSSSTKSTSSSSTTSTSNTRQKTYKGPWDCMKKIYASQGIKGLFRGFPVTILRETPSYGAYFVSYEVFCRSLKSDEEEDLTGLRLMLAGGLSGIVAWGSTYPFDVVKTVIQGDKDIINPRNKPIGTLDCMMMLYRQNGIQSLFRGMVATIARAFPTNVAILTTWQLSMNAFRNAGILQD